MELTSEFVDLMQFLRDRLQVDQWARMLGCLGVSDDSPEELLSRNVSGKTPMEVAFK